MLKALWTQRTQDLHKNTDNALAVWRVAEGGCEARSEANPGMDRPCEAGERPNLLKSKFSHLKTHRNSFFFVLLQFIRMQF